MALLETLALQLVSEPVFFFFLAMIATALWGDASLIFFTAFSVNYGLSLWAVFFAAYIGTTIGDSLWFLLGTYLEPRMEKWPRIKKNYLKIAQMIDLVFKKRYLLALTCVKYLYGTRIITIFYLAKEKIGFKKFLRYNFISTFGWVIGIGLIGWLIGIGFMLLRTFKSVQLAITAVIILLVILHIIRKRINYKIENISTEKRKIIKS